MSYLYVFSHNPYNLHFRHNLKLIQETLILKVYCVCEISFIKTHIFNILQSPVNSVKKHI